MFCCIKQLTKQAKNPTTWSGFCVLLLCFSIAKRGAANSFFKNLAKVTAIAEANLEGDLGDREIRAFQKYLRFFQAVSQNIIGKAAAKGFLEGSAKGAVLHMKLTCRVARGNARGVVRDDVFHHVFAKIHALFGLCVL